MAVLISGPKGILLWGITFVAFVLSVDSGLSGAAATAIGAFVAAGFVDSIFDTGKNELCKLAADMGL